MFLFFTLVENGVPSVWTYFKTFVIYGVFKLL